MAVFDPQERFFSGQTAKKWRFKQEHHEMIGIPDQFVPYEGLFEFEKGALKNESYTYNGSLFRFPLRKEASPLSDNLYSPSKVLELFELFKADAHMILTFLKNLESAELYVRKKEDAKPRKTFEVKIAEDSLRQVRAKRKEFIGKVACLAEEKIIPSEPISVTYPLTIELRSFEGLKSSVSRCEYMLTTYYFGGEITSDVQKLLKAEDLSYLPWVGVALPVDRKTGTKEERFTVKRVKVDEEENKPVPEKTSLQPDGGHLFCFLPLPVPKKSLTGLPVHVNGFFSLSQNRRHLKWPTSNQENSGQELTDKALQWNQFLVNHVVPRAYVDLLQASRDKVPLEVFYAAWPQPLLTDPTWKGLLHPFYQQLLDQPVVRSSADGGAWLKVQDAIFNTLQQGTREVVGGTFELAKKEIVNAPPHVINVLEVFKSQHPIREIAPQLVRDTLRGCRSSYVARSRSEKLVLLKYVLEDSMFVDLYDLELLPLSNGTFTKFLRRDQAAQLMYVSSEEHPQSLLPGLDGLFVDTRSELGSEVTSKLEEAASRGEFY